MLRVIPFRRSAGLLAGYLLDGYLADRLDAQPYTSLRRVRSAVGRRLRDRPRLRTSCQATAAALAAGYLLSPRLRRHPLSQFTVTTLATWAVLGSAGLNKEARATADLLEHGRLATARANLVRLGIDNPYGLEEKALVRLAVEATARNTSTVVTAPLLWGALAGAPGLLGYRAVRALRVQVQRYPRRYGGLGPLVLRVAEAADRIPDQATAVFFTVAAPLAGGDRAEGWRLFREAGAGQAAEAATAGVLGLRLGGPDRVDPRAEPRPEIGYGRPPEPADVRRVARLSRVAGLLAVATPLTWSALAHLARGRANR